MARPPKGLCVSDRDRVLLRRWANAGTSLYRVVRRSRIILLLAEGRSMRDVAKELKVSRTTVILWRTRFDSAGSAALLQDNPRSGRPRRQ